MCLRPLKALEHSLHPRAVQEVERFGFCANDSVIAIIQPSGSNIQTFSIPSAYNSEMSGRLQIGNLGIELLGFLCNKIGASNSLVTPEMGAKISLYCALEPSLGDPKYSGC